MTISVPARCAQPWSCSVAAARNVSAAPRTTFLPSSCCRCQASLPIVVVLPVPFTPTARITVGSWRRSILSVPVRAVSASSSVRRCVSCSPPVRPPASASCSSWATIFAVVGAPTSAMISASSRRSQVSSSRSPSKSVAWTSACSATRVLLMFSRRRLKNPRLRSGSSAWRCRRSPAPSWVMKSSPQSRAIAVGHDIRVPFEIRTVPAGEPPATDLVEAMVAEGIEVYGRRLDSSGAPSATAEQMSPPGGTFVVIYEGDAPVAGGGVKRFSDDIGEIKRMYVVPEARSRGLARMLLSALEDAARELGYARVRLDTGPRQPHARRLYESTGYHAVERYNDNPFADYWAEKEL